MGIMSQMIWLMALGSALLFAFPIFATTGIDRLVLSKVEAMQIAQQEVDYLAPLLETDGWDENTIIVDAFPLYLDGIRGISYYECKAKTNDADAGYVTVNINRTDIPIVGSTTEGKTITEDWEIRQG
jgi:hypothetical protein